jgi:hypothetical protein
MIFNFQYYPSLRHFFEEKFLINISPSINTKLSSYNLKNKETSNLKFYNIYISYIWFYATRTGQEPSRGQKAEYLNHKQPQADLEQADHRLSTEDS